MKEGPDRVRSNRQKTAVVIVLFLASSILPSCRKGEERTGSLQVTGFLDTSRATIGDVLHFQVWVRGAGAKQVQFPDLTVDDPRVAPGKRTDLKGGNRGDVGVDFEVTFWDTGTFTLPPYPVSFLTSGGDTTEYTIATDSLRVTIGTVVNDSDPRLRELKPPVPIPPRIPVRPLLTSASIFVLAGLLIWLWKKRLPFVPENEGYAGPWKSPYEEARAKLAELRRQDLNVPGGVRRFYGDLSFLAREFLEFQYFIRAREMTTEEIEESRIFLPLPEGLVDKLLDLLRRADLVKFARAGPGPEVCRADLDFMEEFVDKSDRERPAGEPSSVSGEIS